LKKIFKKSKNFQNLKKISYAYPLKKSKNEKSLQKFDSLFKNERSVFFYFNKKIPLPIDFYFFNDKIYKPTFTNLFNLKNHSLTPLYNKKIKTAYFVNFSYKINFFFYKNFYKFFEYLSPSSKTLVSVPALLFLLKFFYLNNFFSLSQNDFLFLKIFKNKKYLNNTPLDYYYRTNIINDEIKKIPSKLAKSNQKFKTFFAGAPLKSKFIFLKKISLHAKTSPSLPPFFVLKIFTKRPVTYSFYLKNYRKLESLPNLTIFENSQYFNEFLFLSKTTKILTNTKYFLTFLENKLKCVFFQIDLYDYLNPFFINLNKYSKNFLTTEYLLPFINNPADSGFKLLNRILKLLTFISHLITRDEFKKFNDLTPSAAQSFFFIENDFFFKFIINDRIGCSTLKKSKNFFYFKNFELSTKNFAAYNFRGTMTTSYLQILILFNNPSYFKNLILQIICQNNAQNSFEKTFLMCKEIFTNFYNNYFTHNKALVSNSNLIPNCYFFFILKKKIIKTFEHQKFNSAIIP
jgi:hypothetical protein